jgi:hypothetical protein
MKVDDDNQGYHHRLGVSSSGNKGSITTDLVYDSTMMKISSSLAQSAYDPLTPRTTGATFGSAMMSTSSPMG